LHEQTVDEALRISCMISRKANDETRYEDC